MPKYSSLEMNEEEKSVWQVSRQSTWQAVSLANNQLHFIEQHETLLRELCTKHYSDGQNHMQTIEKLKQVEELLVLMWMSEHMRLRANKIQSYRMEMWWTSENERHAFSQAITEFARERNAMMELYRSKQREWQNVQWTAQWGWARAKKFLEIVNFAWHIAKLFHHKKGNDKKSKQQPTNWMRL